VQLRHLADMSYPACHKQRDETELLQSLRLMKGMPKASSILTVSFRLCFQFGREVSSNSTSSNRPAAKAVKRYTALWRTDAFVQHLGLQHETKWAEYIQLGSA
jgi:hypothetical protein